MLFFLLIAFLAYLPITSFLFFVKNDAFNGYFPPKFFMSESLAAGHLPLWNPYINYGLPQYGDMSSGFWSPITWLIAATVGYNAYNFTLELVCYIIVAGLGMYQLCRGYALSKKVAQIAGVSYMCCGYLVGHLQHFNWITGAAFLPLAVWSYYALNKNFSWKNLLRAALLIYLFVSSSHPGLIIGGIYFFIGYAILLWIEQQKQPGGTANRAFIKSNGLLLGLLALLSLGMIIGYAEIIPYMTRGEKPVLAAASTHHVAVADYMSALFPLSVVTSDALTTDLSMRNVYFGLLLFVCFIAGIGKQTSRHLLFFAGMGIFFLLLAGDSSFKTFGYKYLPLIGYVRLSGEFMLFALFAFIFFAAHYLDRFLLQPEVTRLKLLRIIRALQFLCAAVILFGLSKSVMNGEGLLFQFDTITAATGMASQLKALVDSITVYDAFWIQGSIQLVLLLMFHPAVKSANPNKLLRLVLADMIIATLLNIPFTGAGKASVAEVQSVLNLSPKGIPVPSMQPATALVPIPEARSGLVGDWSFYSKQIGPPEFAFYPIELKQTQKLYKDSSLHQQPFLFTAQHGSISVRNYRGHSIDLDVQTAGRDTLVFKQNLYPHWFYTMNGETVKVTDYKGMLMSAPIGTGQNTLSFHFEPRAIKIAMLVSCIVLVLLLTLWVVWEIRSTSPSSRRISPGP